MAEYKTRYLSYGNEFSALYKSVYKMPEIKFAMHKSFISGIGSLMAIPKGYYRAYQIPCYWDYKALRNDWCQVGDDLRRSYEKLNNEITIK